MNYLKRWGMFFLGMTAILIALLITIPLIGIVIGGLGSIIERKFGTPGVLAYVTFLGILLLSGLAAIEP